jgi:hypothetical protein
MTGCGGQAADNSKIVGTWQIGDTDLKSVYTFNQDGTYSTDQIDVTLSMQSSGRYELKGDMLTMRPEKGDAQGPVSMTYKIKQHILDPATIPVAFEGTDTLVLKQPKMEAITLKRVKPGK